MRGDLAMWPGRAPGLKPVNALVQFPHDFLAGHDLPAASCASLSATASSHLAGAMAGVEASSIGEGSGRFGPAFQSGDVDVRAVFA